MQSVGHDLAEKLLVLILQKSLVYITASSSAARICDVIKVANSANNDQVFLSPDVGLHYVHLSHTCFNAGFL